MIHSFCRAPMKELAAPKRQKETENHEGEEKLISGSNILLQKYSGGWTQSQDFFSFFGCFLWLKRCLQQPKRTRKEIASTSWIRPVCVVKIKSKFINLAGKTLSFLFVWRSTNKRNTNHSARHYKNIVSGTWGPIKYFTREVEASCVNQKLMFLQFISCWSLLWAPDKETKGMAQRI
jgi:hypothetical protein